MKKISNSQRSISASLSLVALSLFTVSSAFASPADEISRAVRVAGGADVRQAAAAEFLQGFRTVVLRVNEREMPLYVTAAIKMRDDIAPQITVAALNAHPLARDSRCEGIGAVVKVAIAAAPNARDAIVRAALAAQPSSQRCILAAAGIEGNLLLAYTKRTSDGKQVVDGKDTVDSKQAIEPRRETTFFPPSIDVGNIISINPGPGGCVSPCSPPRRR